MTVKRVISGGQTGADQAGLAAAQSLGIDTGGCAPWNWMTDDGPAEGLLVAYGLMPGPKDSSIYRKRTEANVRDSDGTVLFGKLSSPGSRLTHTYCMQYMRP